MSSFDSSDSSNRDPEWSFDDEMRLLASITTHLDLNDNERMAAVLHDLRDRSSPIVRAEYARLIRVMLL
ncbi:hypothetical protein A2U01_0039550 [Trifolium medium]|uniref:Uncharacterized protein n=1 Tax=Trifolium medium TaxID=97028 RepID=A0A392Q4C9_9FABA|nr:hypothetical protein [Trifolium medium]